MSKEAFLLLSWILIILTSGFAGVMTAILGLEVTKYIGTFLIVFFFITVIVAILWIFYKVWTVDDE